MKKLLLTLVSVLFTLNSFSQSYIKAEKVNGGSISQVGDTLVVKLQYGDPNSLGNAKLTQFDFQYNNKLLSLVSRDWQITSSSAQKAYNSWTGYKWGGTFSTDLDGQYSDFQDGSSTYATNADWSVERVTVQDVTAFTAGGEFIQYKLKIKDKAELDTLMNKEEYDKFAKESGN
mgnify:CR=1 FL=1